MFTCNCQLLIPKCTDRDTDTVPQYKRRDIELVLTQHASEPDGQILLHGHQRGLVPHRQPLVILEDVCEAGAVPLH